MLSGRQLLEFEKENKAETTFTVPRRAVARILGRSGATINEIKESTDTQIDIEKGESEQVHITIHGNKINIAEAKASILEIAESVPEEKSDSVIIETQFHRTLIGAGGQGLRDIIVRAGGPDDPRLHVGLVRLYAQLPCTLVR
jgi:polyribonucleotide nucleotidyltransferase